MTEVNFLFGIGQYIKPKAKMVDGKMLFPKPHERFHVQSRIYTEMMVKEELKTIIMYEVTTISLQGKKMVGTIQEGDYELINEALKTA